MTKWYLSVLFFLLLPLFSFCQQPIIEVQNSGGTFFLAHTVAPKENFYSIGRLYNVSPRELASFNKLSMENGLNIGQHLKIPLDKNNFVQSTSKNAAEALVPLYHIVAPDETLFRIGMNYKNVPVNSLKKWNHLTSDQVARGTSLVIGYLKVNKSESALAHAKFNIPSANNNQVTANNISKDPPQTKSNPAPVKEETTREEPQVKPDTEPVKTAPEPTAKSDSKSVNEGYFKKEYLDEMKSGSVASANATTSIFKSTSGWQDGKYYCFNNDATPGSILKISIPGTGNSVYAKVLDAIPDIKQNEGVQLVLSNAAASSLGTTDEKFETTITFVK